MHPRHPGMASASSSCATGTSAQAPSPTPLDERLPSQRRSVRRQPAASAVLRVALSAKSCQSVSEIQTLIPKIFIFFYLFFLFRAPATATSAPQAVLCRDSRHNPFRSSRRGGVPQLQSRISASIRNDALPGTTCNLSSASSHRTRNPRRALASPACRTRLG